MIIESTDYAEVDFDTSEEDENSDDYSQNELFNDLNNLKSEILTVPENPQNYGVRENLGLRYKIGKNGKTEQYLTSRFCGCCYLKDKNREDIIDKDGERVILSLCKSRFEIKDEDNKKGKNSKSKDNESNAILNMLDTIASDEEFDEYLCMDLPEGERLITYFFDEDLIFADEITKDNKMLTYISFIHLVLNSTKRGLMSKMVKKSENFNGKVRGKIDVKYQISKNIMRGRKDRIYCSYSEKSVDILENQILKYALTIISDSKIAGLKNLQRSINILKRRFSAVSDRKVTPAEIDRIILPSMYQNYKSMFQLAKVIISDISMYNTESGSKKGLVPYAINMPLLFECYVRTIIKEKIEVINNDKNIPYRIEMKKFVPNKTGKSYDESYGCVMSTKDKCYIQGLLVPDIVLAYYKKESEDKEYEDNAKPLFYRVYDVKYKKPCESSNSSIRNDRLQFLAYCFMYGVTKRSDIEKEFSIQDTDDNSAAKDTRDKYWYSGLIFPSQSDKNTEGVEINRKNKSDDVYYHQVFINIEDKEDKDNTAQCLNWLKWY